MDNWLLYGDFIQDPLDALLTVGNGRRAAGTHQVQQLLAQFAVGLFQTRIIGTSGGIARSVNVINEFNLVKSQLD